MSVPAHDKWYFPGYGGGPLAQSGGAAKPNGTKVVFFLVVVYKI